MPFPGQLDTIGDAYMVRLSSCAAAQDLTTASSLILPAARLAALLSLHDRPCPALRSAAT